MYLRIATWHPNMPQHEKDRKIWQAGIKIYHILRARNKENCISIAISLISRLKNCPFLQKTIAGNKKWVLYNTGIAKFSELTRSLSSLT